MTRLSVKARMAPVIAMALSATIAGVGTVAQAASHNYVLQHRESAATKIDPVTGLPAYHKHVTLTFWSWVPNDATRVKIFEKYYPTIKVKLEDVGAGTPEYQKFSTAIQSGSGAPDVVMLEYDMMPEFIHLGGLRPITNIVKPFVSGYPKWVMNQVTYKGQIYSVPEDTGPLGLFYQNSIFHREHIAIPKTWAQYRADALAFKKHNKGKYWSYFATNDGQWQLGLVWDAGINPFQRTGHGWKIDINSPAVVHLFEYWGSLIKAGTVLPVSDGSPGFQKQLNQGTFATIVGSAWYPSEFLVPYDHNLKLQDWHAAFTPEWKPGQTVDGNWGGSSDAVTKQSRHPLAASIFATFINTSKFEQPHNVTPAAEGGGGLFPAYKGGFAVSAFKAPNPALGNQPAFKDVFSKEATHIDSRWQWNPWATYTFDELQSQLTKAADGQESYRQALNTTENAIVTYAESQGFNVQR